MNNFPIESPTDLFGSGFIGSCNGLFESPLSFIGDVPLIIDIEPHMAYYSGEMQSQLPINATSYGISVGSTCEPAMTVGSQVELSVSDCGVPTDIVDNNSPAVVMDATAVDNSGTGDVETIDNSVNVGSIDVSAESIVKIEAAVDVDISGFAELLGSQNATCDVKSETETSENNDEPVIDISISNVVCAFNTKCYLSLKKVAHDGMNVEYKKATGTVLMKLRKPMVTANIWASGKVTCTGSRSEDEARVAARRVARCLQKIYRNARFCEFRIVNVLGTCSLPFGIRITEFSRCYPKEASYEPELHPGVTYRITSPKATLKIFSTGSITVTAPCVNNVQRAVEHIYPLVVKFRMGKCKEPLLEAHSSDFKQPSYFQQLKSSLAKSNESYRKAKNPHLDDENRDDSESDEMSDSDGRW